MIRNVGWFIFNYMTMLMIRQGWVKSPSLSLHGFDPKNFEARVTALGITWIPKVKDREL